MERMLVVVFDDESKAYEGSRALNQLDSEGSISVNAEAVIQKKADGSATVQDAGDDFPIRTASGTAIGSLIGLLGGPIGVGIGAATGAFAGYVADLNRAGVNVDYLSDVSAKLAPGKWAVVSDVDEEWETPVDTRMEALGGTVFRATRENVEEEQNARDIAALNSEIDQLNEEEAQSQGEDKSKLRAKIDSLKNKLRTKKQQQKEQADRQRKEIETKVHALEEKAKKARGDAKKKIEARVDSLRKKSTESADQPKVVVQQ